MLDTHQQARFTRSCTDAAYGYTAAATAAYSAFADQVLNFWADALQPSDGRRDTAPAFPAFNAFLPVSQPAPPAPYNPFAWMTELWLQPPPTTCSRPTSTSGFPFAPWFGAFPFAASPTVWPMAYMLIGAGVPRTVAWPAAEANAAMMDAADVMTTSVKQAGSSYQSQSGHAVAPVWAQAPLPMLAAFDPFNINAMLAAFQFA